MVQHPPKILILNNWSISHGKIYYNIPGTNSYKNDTGFIKDYRAEQMIKSDNPEIISKEEQNKWRLVHGLKTI